MIIQQTDALHCNVVLSLYVYVKLSSFIYSCVNSNDVTGEFVSKHMIIRSRLQLTYPKFEIIKSLDTNEEIIYEPQ